MAQTVEELARELWTVHFELTDPKQWEFCEEGQKEQYRRIARHAIELLKPLKWTDQDLYDAYLRGCEDECLPEPLGKGTFLASWEDTVDVQ